MQRRASLRRPGGVVSARIVVPLLLAAAVVAAAASCSPHDDGAEPTGGPVSAGSSTTPVAPSGSGTSTSVSSSAATTGILAGRLVRVGGPYPGLPHPLPGTVTVTGPGGRHRVAVPADGTWSISLPPGRYTVEGRSPQMDDGRMPCVAPSAVTVVAGTTVRADAVCAVP